MSSHSKELKFIKTAVSNLSINLENKIVLTEIGNNYYFYLPFIAAIAGAKKVYAWTSDNTHFDCKEIVKEAKKLAKDLQLNDTIHFSVNEKPTDQINQADIITNSGFLRPLNKQFLSNCKKEVAIALMFEAWEIRDTDIDIDYCKENKMKVGGTNESHPSINVFESVGPLAIKLAFEAGMEVFQNNILVWSDDEFGNVTENYFLKMNAKNVFKTTDKNNALEYLKTADFMYFCSNHEKRTIISNSATNSIFTIDEIKKINPDITIVHLYGKFTYSELYSAGLNVFPKQDGKAEYMSKTLNHIGMQPTINLFCAGFKVGEELSNNKITSLTQII